MTELSLKRRTRLRAKEEKEVLAWMKDEWGIEVQGTLEIDGGQLDDRKAYVSKGKIVAIEEGGKLLLTVHGVMVLKPSKRWLVVDMGAVPYLANGADVMGPGIVDANPEIEKDDMVWVMDVKNKRPLCTGKALISGKEMLSKRPGKAVKTVHFVGDEIWNATL